MKSPGGLSSSIAPSWRYLLPGVLHGSSYADLARQAPALALTRTRCHRASRAGLTSHTIDRRVSVYFLEV